MTEELIRCAQSGSDAHTLELIQKFDPLLHKLSRDLGYEDAYDDLLLDFIILIHDINLDKFNSLTEACLVSYIAKSVHHSFIGRSAKANDKAIRLIYISDLSDQQKYYIEAKYAVYNDFSNIDFELLRSYISTREWWILEQIYIKGYPVSEIAHQCKISRQAVNQIKKRALNKLQEALLNAE